MICTSFQHLTRSQRIADPPLFEKSSIFYLYHEM
jgi:hypothetical protein